LNHVTTQGAYAAVTGMVTLVAYWLAGIYETPYVLLVAILLLWISMTLAMRFFGEEVSPATKQA
jgi:site-specific recombinase